MRLVPSVSNRGAVSIIVLLAAEAYEKLGDFVQAIEWYQLYKQHAHLNDDSEIDERIEDLRRSTS
jgi:hypothetical protein